MLRPTLVLLVLIVALGGLRRVSDARFADTSRAQRVGMILVVGVLGTGLIAALPTLFGTG